MLRCLKSVPEAKVGVAYGSLIPVTTIDVTFTKVLTNHHHWPGKLSLTKAFCWVCARVASVIIFLNYGLLLHLTHPIQHLNAY